MRESEASALCFHRTTWLSIRLPGTPIHGLQRRVFARLPRSSQKKQGSTSGRTRLREFSDKISQAKTIVWNGPMGMFEHAPFDAGTRAIAQSVAAADAISIVGGGDSVAAITEAGVADRITHVSTGGGASLEFLAGEILPGVAALTEK